MVSNDDHHIQGLARYFQCYRNINYVFCPYRFLFSLCQNSFRSKQQKANSNQLWPKENLFMHITENHEDLWLQAELDPGAQMMSLRVYLHL